MNILLIKIHLRYILRVRKEYSMLITFFLFIIFNIHSTLAQHHHNEMVRGRDSAGYVLIRFSEDTIKISETHFSDSSYKILHGKEILFRPSGLSSEVRFYQKNKLVQQEYFYENGTKKLVKIFSDSVHNYIWRDYWDSSGVQLLKDGNGELEILTGNILERGEVLNGVRHGKWIGKILDEDRFFVEWYEFNQLIAGRSGRFAYTQRATAAGGLRHPKRVLKSVQKGLHGGTSQVLYLDVSLDEKGIPLEVSIRGVCSEEAKNKIVQSIKQQGRWEPAKKFGAPVPSEVTLPVRVCLY